MRTSFTNTDELDPFHSIIGGKRDSIRFKSVPSELARTILVLKRSGRTSGGVLTKNNFAGKEKESKEKKELHGCGSF